MSTTKIKLKEGYPQGYLPQGVSYTNYTMLVAIANYSKNLVCVSNAKAMLDEDMRGDWWEPDVRTAEKKRLMDGMGSFMHAVCVSDFAMAWRRADGSNREALIQGLTNNEIEL
jgi:hypothetical protein|tara:strand:+ start:677 stop:1015 length:339 start_codon:yes stop_codon:yes gene_type:complete